MSTSTDPTKPLPIPIPTSLSSTTPALPKLTSELLVAHLRSQTTTIPDLMSLLSDSLARTGWTDRVRALALELLRSGKCESFPELFEEVLSRVKVPQDISASGSGEKDQQPSGGGKHGGKTIPGMGKPSATREEKEGTSTPTSTQAAIQNGNNGAISVREGWFGPDGLPDVKIPVATVEAAAEFLKERVKDEVEVVEDD